MNRSYSELIRLNTFNERFEYLRLSALIGDVTFGYERYLNQILYSSDAWKKFRKNIIIRDNGCDLACPERDNIYPVIVHHINPITVQDILDENPAIFDANNVICVSDQTHKAIHYGANAPSSILVERQAGDTCLWR